MDITPTTIGRFIIATGAAATWLMTGPATQDAPVRDAQPAVARPTDSDSVPPANFTNVLRERMREPVEPQRGRNPFTFGSRAVRREETPVMRESQPVVAAPVERPLPVFKLSGIAASRENDAIVLTAIVIDNGAMVFVKTGDKLSNGYSVVRVDEGSITLVDAAGVTQTLRLP